MYYYWDFIFGGIYMCIKRLDNIKNFNKVKELKNK